MTPEPPVEVVALAEERAEARSSKDFAAADELREAIAAAGWTVADEPDGTFALTPSESAEPVNTQPEHRLAAATVASVLDEPPTHDATIAWVCEGWPDDIDRALGGFRVAAGSRSLQFTVADVTGEPADRWGSDVEVIPLEEGTGWAAARNAGLRRSRGRVVLVMDGSIEPVGDAVEPMVAALEDPSVGVCGPFGIVTHDLREFEPTSGPECDAVEGYLMAFRRDLLQEVGSFDEKFRWYRTADIEWSFRVADAGYRRLVVEAPVTKHEHRMWFETPPQERATWSKRNYYRFLDRFRGREDLTIAGRDDA